MSFRRQFNFPGHHETEFRKQQRWLREIEESAGETHRTAGRRNVRPDTNIGENYEPSLNAQVQVRRGEDVGKALKKLKRAMSREFGYAGRNARGIMDGSGFHAADGRRFEKPSTIARHAHEEAVYGNAVRLEFED